MSCPKCKVNTIRTHAFIRMNPKGEHGIFWCEPCAQKHEPELYKNLMEDVSPVEKDLKKKL